MKLNNSPVAKAAIALGNVEIVVVTFIAIPIVEIVIMHQNPC